MVTSYADDNIHQELVLIRGAEVENPLSEIPLKYNQVRGEKRRASDPVHNNLQVVSLFMATLRPAQVYHGVGFFHLHLQVFIFPVLAGWVKLCLKPIAPVVAGHRSFSIP